MISSRGLCTWLRPTASSCGDRARPGCREVRSDEGAAIVEMALVCTILFAMLFGIFEMSLALYAYDYVSDAAREGARWAIVRGSQCSANTPTLDHCNASSSDIQTYVQNLGFPYASSVAVSTTWCNASVNSSGVTSWATPPCSGTNDPGNQARVVVTIQLPLAIPFVMNRPITMTSTSAMVVSQ
jgi:Flp pilus assembly protein TadG